LIAEVVEIGEIVRRHAAWIYYRCWLGKGLMWFEFDGMRRSLGLDVSGIAVVREKTGDEEILAGVQF
jgi:hypothetical protein